MTLVRYVDDSISITRTDGHVDNSGIFILEGRVSDDDGMQDNNDRPNVGFETMPIGGIEQHLGRNIVRGTTHILPFAWLVNERS